jgi:hypothetical protein
MSDAVARTLAVGRVSPEILTAARTIMAAGWRVTSIYRPSGTHAQGISLDAAPLVFVSGGFGLRTAGLIWRLVKSKQPDVKWLANAELDHVHVQIFNRDALSYNHQHGTIIFPIEKFQAPSVIKLGPSYKL